MAGVKRKKRSVAWDYFIKENESLAKCDLHVCGDKIKTSGNTSNLFKVNLISISLLIM